MISKETVASQGKQNIFKIPRQRRKLSAKEDNVYGWEIP